MTAAQSYYPDNRMFHASVSGVMGTRLDVLMLGMESEEQGSQLWAQCLDEVLWLENAGSKFLPGSETTRVNMAEPLSLVDVSDRFRELLAAASVYREKTLGAFDVTVGCRGNIGFDAEGRLVVPASGLAVDLGGFLKGVAVDAIARRLREHGVKDAYIDFGGSSIMGLGSHPAGNGWQVSVTDPYTHRSLRTVMLRDSSLSTSGNTPAYNGHIIDPFTGRIVSGNRLSAVVAAKAADAEVLSTAWLVADSAAREKILENFDTVTEEFVYN